jgi:hypothetical protein
LYIQSIAICLRDLLKITRLLVFPLLITIMARPTGTPRQPLEEVSLNTRSRVVGARDYRIKFTAITRLEELTDSTC